MQDEESAYMLLAGNSKGKRTLGRPKLTSVSNIKMDLVKKGWGGIGGVGLDEDKD
jgi:hypothetical protein